MPLLDSWNGAKERSAALQRIWASTKEIVRRNPGVEAPRRLGIDLAGQSRSRAQRKLERFIEKMDRQIDESRFIELASVFERILFAHVERASKEMKHHLATSYPSEGPFRSFACGFIKTEEDIRSLGGIGLLLSSALSARSMEEFRAIVDYRNYLLHGKRFSPMPEAVAPDYAEAALDRILLETGIRRTSQEDDELRP